MLQYFNGSKIQGEQLSLVVEKHLTKRICTLTQVAGLCTLSTTAYFLPANSVYWHGVTARSSVRFEMERLLAHLNSSAGHRCSFEFGPSAAAHYHGATLWSEFGETHYEGMRHCSATPEKKRPETITNHHVACCKEPVLSSVMTPVTSLRSFGYQLSPATQPNRKHKRIRRRVNTQRIIAGEINVLQSHLRTLTGPTQA